MSTHIYMGTRGFVIPFTSKIDLSGMTSVTMEITRAAGPKDEFTFQPADFQSVGAGDVLEYVARASDFTVPGPCSLQCVARNAAVEIPFDPLIIEVKRRGQQRKF